MPTIHEIAEHHFDRLTSRGNSEIKEDKGDFISNYPLSCLPYVTPKRFWQACLETKIVHHEYYDSKQLFNDFERILHDCIEMYRFSDLESTRKEFHAKVAQLFADIKPFPNA